MRSRLAFSDWQSRDWWRVCALARAPLSLLVLLAFRLMGQKWPRTSLGCCSPPPGCVSASSEILSLWNSISMSLVGLPPLGGGGQSSSSLRMSLSLTRPSENSARPFPGEPPLESCLPSAAGQPLLCVVPLLRLPSSESSEWPLPVSPGHSLLEEFLRTRRDLEEAAGRKRVALRRQTRLHELGPAPCGVGVHVLLALPCVLPSGGTATLKVKPARAGTARSYSGLSKRKL